MAQYNTGGDTLSEEQAAQVKDLKKTVNCNLAMVYLKQDRPDKAADCARSAVELDETCTKGHFRLGQALVKLGKFEQAKESLMVAARQAPQDRNIRAELEAWKVSYGEWKSKEDKIAKELYAGKM